MGRQQQVQFNSIAGNNNSSVPCTENSSALIGRSKSHPQDCWWINETGRDPRPDRSFSLSRSWQCSRLCGHRRSVTCSRLVDSVAVNRQGLRHPPFPHTEHSHQCWLQEEELNGCEALAHRYRAACAGFWAGQEELSWSRILASRKELRSRRPGTPSARVGSPTE